MNEITQIAFDYTKIEEVTQRERVQVAALDIKKRLQRAQGDLIMVGQRLIDVKDQLDHGLFQTWIEQEFPFSYRTAANMMAVAEKFGGKSETVALLNDSTLYMLAGASVPDQVVDQVVEQARQNGKVPSKTEVKAIVNAARPIKLQPAPAPAQRQPESAPAPTPYVEDRSLVQPRPLTAGEVLAVIQRAAAKNGGQTKKSQGAWIALNFSPSNYAEALNGDNVYITREAFTLAYKDAQIVYGLRRPDNLPIRMAEPPQPPTEAASEPVPQTPHQQKQAALQAELDFWREAAQRSARAGELTGNFSAMLGLDREIAKVIALLKNNVID